MTLSNNQPRTNPAGIRFKPQAGVALVAALLLLLVITAMAVTLMYAAIIWFTNFVVDILYSVLDPRVRLT